MPKKTKLNKAERELLAAQITMCGDEMRAINRTVDFLETTHDRVAEFRKEKISELCVSLNMPGMKHASELDRLAFINKNGLSVI